MRLLANINGPDHWGITAAITKAIQMHGGEILDMGQAITHGFLSLGLVVEAPTEELSRKMEESCEQMGLSFSCRLLHNIPRPFKGQGKFVLALASATELPVGLIHEVSQFLANEKINILRLENLNPENFKSLEITSDLGHHHDIQKIQKKVLSLSNTYKVDMAFFRDGVFRRAKRLIVLDMDGTLVEGEIINLMAQHLGPEVFERVRDITQWAMAGEMDFAQALRERVALLKGFPEKDLPLVLDRAPLNSGVSKFIKTVKRLGHRVAIVSGGFTYFSEAFKKKLGIDYAFANELEIVDGALTGKIVGPIIDGAQKENLLRLMAQQEGIGLEQVVAVGDGANDLPMLQAAGLGVAFHAQGAIGQKATHRLGHGPMNSILCFLGISPEGLS